MAKIRALKRRLAKVEALAPSTTTGPTAAPGQVTPSAALVAEAQAQGVSLATLLALSPENLAKLQAAFDAGQLSGK